MYVFFRLFKTLFLDCFKSRIGIFDTAVTSLRVWPNDLDINLHLNNGRYLTLMDIGRFDLSWQTGLLQVALKRGWLPVLGSAHIVFRRSMRVFQKFELKTRMLWWDEKWFYMEQTFVCNGNVYARTIVRGVFRHKGRNVPISDIISAMGVESIFPERPAIIEQWIALESSMAEVETYEPIPESRIEKNLNNSR